MAEELTEERLAEIKGVFDDIDADGSGKISAEEIGSALEAIGHSLSKSEIDDIVKKVDLDEDGSVSFSEFVTLSSMVLDVKTEGQIIEAFEDCDEDGIGFVTADQIKQVMEQLGQKLTDEEMEGIIEKTEKDEDGRINYTEFAKLLKSM